MSNPVIISKSLGLVAFKLPSHLDTTVPYDRSRDHNVSLPVSELSDKEAKDYWAKMEPVWLAHVADARNRRPKE